MVVFVVSRSALGMTQGELANARTVAQRMNHPRFFQVAQRAVDRHTISPVKLFLDFPLAARQCAAAQPFCDGQPNRRYAQAMPPEEFFGGFV